MKVLIFWLVIVKGENGFISYYESCLMLTCENWKEFWNEAQSVPYAKGKDNFPWAGYDNVKSMKIKAEYIMKKKLGGAMFWTLDLDDFTSKFCCQGFFPLMRTVKSVLENEPKFMPPNKICSACPTTEYKKFKKQYSRKKRAAATAEEVCAENGEGSWEDPNDCTQYYVCRSIATAWREMKLEKCYVGSYFDKLAKQCRWVGENGLNCESILSDDDSDDNNNSKPVKKTMTEAPDAEEGETTQHHAKSTTETDNLNTNKQKIFYDLTPSKLQSDTFITPDLYTCTAEKKENFEQDADYIKCYACENSNAPNCQSANATVIPCYLKTQKCYTKALYNNNNVLISFSKGCASKADLDSFLAEIGAEEEHPFKKSKHQASCVRKTKTTKLCYDLCQTNLCNAKHDFSSFSLRVLANRSLVFLTNFALFLALSI